jgi:hypothetical protein
LLVRPRAAGRRRAQWRRVRGYLPDVAARVYHALGRPALPGTQKGVAVGPS